MNHSNDWMIHSMISLNEPEIIGFLQFHSMKSTSFNEKIIQWNEIFSNELKMKWFLKFSMQWNENEMISQNFNEMKWKWNIWYKFHRMINENANEKLIRNSTLLHDCNGTFCLRKIFVPLNKQKLYAKSLEMTQDIGFTLNLSSPEYS